MEPTRLVLLPIDPDGSARTLRQALRERHGLDVAVVITDTMGRPWRMGLVDVAIGAAGIDPVTDYRGTVDAYGNELLVTQTAVIDELAAAAELVKGKRGQVPVAVVRGLPGPPGTGAGPAGPAADGPGAAALIRPADQDLFSLGTAEAHALGLRTAAALPDAVDFAGERVDPAAVDRALDGFDLPRVTDDRVLDKLRGVLPEHTGVVLVPAAAVRPWALAQAGALVHRARAALVAEGLATAWVPADPALLADLVPLPPGQTTLGLLAIGVPRPAGAAVAVPRPAGRP